MRSTAHSCYIHRKKWYQLFVILCLCFLVLYYLQWRTLNDFEAYIWLNKARPVSRTSCALPTPPSLMKEDEKLKIALLMMYDNADGSWAEDLMSRVLQNKQIYCDRHGYTLINANDKIDRSRPVAWSKLLAVETHLASDKYDYIMYIDMDAIVMNGAYKVETFIYSAALLNPQSDFILTNDWNGLNTGVWIAKNTEWTRWFLKTAWEQKQLVEKSSSKGIPYPFEYEQRAFHYLTNSDVWRKRKLPTYPGNITEIRSHFHAFPQCSMNSYSMHPLDRRGNREETQYVPGDFIVHFAGKKGKMKTDLLRHYLDCSMEHMDQSI
jgi:hypothetical protein